MIKRIKEWRRRAAIHALDRARYDYESWLDTALPDDPLCSVIDLAYRDRIRRMVERVARWT